MSFCTSCGGKLIDGDKFCRSCGSRVEPCDAELSDDDSFAAYRKPVGKESPLSNKCPACGETLECDDEVCPTCGYEVAQETASQAIERFTDEIDKLELSATSGEISYKQVARAIEKFKVPNNPQAALAFLSVAGERVCSNASDYDQGRAAKSAVRNAWASRARTVHDEAITSFSSDPLTKQIEESYSKIAAVSGAKNVASGIGDARESVLKLGCLGQFIWFYIVLMALAVICAALGAVRSIPAGVWISVALIVVLVMICRRKRRNNTKSK